MVDLDAIPRIYCNADHSGVSVQAATPAQTARSYKSKRPSSSPRVVSSRSNDRQTTNRPPPSDRPQRKPAPTNRRPHTARLSRESGSRGATTAAWPNHVPLRSKRQSPPQQEAPLATLATGTYFWKPASSAINKDWQGPRNLLLPGGKCSVDPDWQEKLWDEKLGARTKPGTHTPPSKCAALEAQKHRSQRNDWTSKSGASSARRARPATAGVGLHIVSRGRGRNWSMPQPKAVEDLLDKSSSGFISIRDPDFAPKRKFIRQACSKNDAARYEGKIHKLKPPKMVRPVSSRGTCAIRQGLIGEVGNSGGVYTG